MRTSYLVTALVLTLFVWVASRPPPLEAQDRQVTFSMIQKFEDRLKTLESVPTGPVTKKEIARFKRLEEVAKASRRDA